MIKNKKIFLILCCIVFLGFVLRTYNLGKESFWVDEAYSVHETQFSLDRIKFGTDANPPLYYYLLYFWNKLVGITEFNVRMLSVIFGTASIWFLYLLGKNVFNDEVGLYAALMLAVSPIHILYSQEARNYSLLFMFSLISMHSYLNLRKNFSKISIIYYREL